MTGQTPLYAYPYLTGTDGGKQIKTVSKALAERIEATMQNAGTVPLDSDLVALLTRLAVLEAQVDALPDPDDTGWQTLPLFNGWVTFGGAYTAPRYRRLNHVAHVTALVKSGVTSAGTVIAKLPAGCRPEQQLLIPTSVSSPATAAWFDVLTNGDIVCGAGISAAFTPLAFSFVAA